MGEGNARGVGEADLDRAPRIELADLLARDHLLARLHRRGHSLIDEDVLAGLRAVQQSVEDALTGGASAAVRPAWSADPPDAGGADGVDRAPPHVGDALVGPAPERGRERGLVAGARGRGGADG